MHAEDIKAALRKKGHTLSSIAGAFRSRAGELVTKGAVSRVVRGELQSARIALHISKLLGVPVGELWPGKYPKLEVLLRTARAVEASAKARAKPRKPAEAPVAAPAAQGELQITDPRKPGRLGRKREGPSAARDARSNHRERR